MDPNLFAVDGRRPFLAEQFAELLGIHAGKKRKPFVVRIVTHPR